eukprot:EG_transcript_11049
MAITADAIRAAVDALFGAEVALLQDLVRHRSLVGQPAERDIQRFLARLLREDLKLPEVDEWEIQLADVEGKPNFSPVFGEWHNKVGVVGIHRPSGPPLGKSLILNGHVDVVPAGPEDLWSHDPFDPVVEGDWLYGRGSGDMKAGIAAAYYAVKALHHCGVQPAAELQFHFVTDEECTGNGALAVVERGYRADACLIPEPFPFIMTAQLGVLWMHLQVTGRPAHVLDTSAGVNAIEGAMQMYAALKKLEESWNRPEARHAAYADLKHPVNFNLGRIEGGEWGSTVPSRCSMTVRLGFYPGTDVTEAKQAVEKVLADAAKEVGVTCEVSYAGFAANGCTVSADSDLVRALQRAYRDAGMGDEPPPLLPACCTTDARYYTLNCGIPTTCFGPKSVRNIHGIDERVSLQSLKDVTCVLAMFVAQWCGVEPLPAAPQK